MTSQVGVPSLVWTKLEPPITRGLVSRTELVASLVRSHGRLVVIRAPAGWGKTTLLADWSAAGEETRPFAWLRLDAADNDPIRFWSHLVEAIHRVNPDAGVDASVLLRVTGVGIASHVLPVLVNALTAAPQPAVLALDDYHLITNPDVDDQLGYLLEHLPAGGLLVVLASRATPALPLARLRVRGELMEIDPRSLRFSVDEAAKLINGLHGLALPPDLVARLTERTEGWAAGLYLAVLSLRGRDDAAALVRSFTGTEALVVDFLRAEVLAGHSEQVRRFLRRTAILARLCGGLCDRVTGASGSAVLLAELEESNLLLTPLDTHREWFRYHHLFAELLLGELRRVEPELIAELHRRAAGWFVAAGEVTDAITHYVAARGHAEAAELIARHWSPYVQAKLDVTVAGWLAALPTETVRADARLCIAAATVALSQGDGDAAARWISDIEQAEPSGPFYDGFSSAASGAATTRAILGMTRGELAVTQRAARRAAELEQPSSPWHAVAVNVYGITLRWMGHGQRAEQVLTAGISAARANGMQVMPIVYGLGQLAALCADRLDWPRANEVAGEALRVADEHAVGEHWVCGIAHLVRGRVLSGSGDLPAGQAALLRGVELAQRGAGPLDVAWGTLALAGVLAAAGDQPAARVALARAHTTLADCPDPGPVLRDLLATTTRRLGADLPGPAAHRSDGQLTDRELDVLRLLATSLSQREIGEALHLSHNTVKTHIRNIFRKLHASNRAHAVTVAHHRGLI